MDRKPEVKSPTVVISRKDMVDENIIQRCLQQASLLNSDLIADRSRLDLNLSFNSVNVMTSTPVRDLNRRKTKTPLKNVPDNLKKSQSVEKRPKRPNSRSEDDECDQQFTDENETDDVSVDRAKFATSKRKKTFNIIDGSEEEDEEGSAIRNISKTPICLPMKWRRLDRAFEDDSSMDVNISAASGRSLRSAALRARQRVKCLDWSDEQANSNRNQREDDEFVEKCSKLDDEDDYLNNEDDDDDDDESLGDDGDSIMTMKESGRMGSGKDAIKRKKWSDQAEKDLVLKLKQKQQGLKLLPDWMPKEESYKKMLPEEGRKYLPVNQRIKFRIQRKSSAPPPQSSIELNLFEHHTTDDSFTIKVGGPVWSMDWCPVPLHAPVNQFLAVYTHQSPAQVHTCTTMSAQHQKCLVQIWDFGILPNRTAQGKPRLLPLLVVEGGPLWQMKWAPGASTWKCEDEYDGFECRIGLLAVACHSGHVKVFSIPRFSTLKDEPRPGSLEFYEVVPSATLKATGSSVSSCTCLDWNVNGQHPIIAAGFADGMVALWNLSIQSTLSSGLKHQGMLALHPYRTFKAHLSVVSGLNFCPTSDDLLLSCSHDKYFKVWNVNETNRCLVSHRAYKFTASTWPAVERSRFYVGFDEAYIHQRNSVVCYNFYESKVVHISHCLHNSTITSVSHKEWSNLITSCDNTGCVQSCLSIPEKVKGIFSYRKMVSMMQVEGDATESNSDADCECRKFADPHKPNEGCFPIICCCNKSFLIKDFDKSWQYRSSIKNQSELPFDDIIKNPYSALHRIAWNPNKEHSDWLAFGGFNGLLRIRFVPDINTKK